MVDFRYHLVSLVSVFLALAVGVILGAGPLQDSIGTTLTDQVTSLRASRDQARAEADTANAKLDVTNTQLDAAAVQIVSGRLSGQSIAIVALPGAQSEQIDEIREKLGTAGASVSGVVKLTDKYAATSGATYRAALAGTIAQYAGVDPAAGTENILATAVAHVVRAGSADANASVILDTMRTANNELLSVEGDLAAAGGVVIVAPQKFTPADSKTNADDEIASMVKSFTALDTVMASKGATVVAGSLADSNSAIAVLREAKAGSSVDSIEAVAGAYNVALALASEFAGSHVTLGTADGAQAFGTGK